MRIPKLLNAQKTQNLRKNVNAMRIRKVFIAQKTRKLRKNVTPCVPTKFFPQKNRNLRKNYVRKRMQHTQRTKY